ncbi:[protein release factor]-glutamine N5-methyltransferase [Ectothiorhodosinus mongolicus]|uniref:Release factor glutamine methyltransferase n=1 Tax=Ectothiorhodosinus mongolicus TaxID=233100 RepID=A0A1R3W157_9GAMM|nr:peptide chain release factor N(5)-glutamine methyltransferase [Ectothiorhodosinus mongolicus]ULX57353.1 protein-(glutamine-N5) methyltransferase, release factor-specific [Ectothiorhodosinus mongolicus]SIT71121.1 [protein release factor]-glutamine N5-methyltransferase [Ectothiorhodosinus mongolicus]
MNYQQLLAEMQQALEGFDAAELEAQWLLAHALCRDRAWLYAHGEDEITDPLLRNETRALTNRRCQGEPLAYILGHQEFWSLRLSVTPDVLIPRADTETLVEVALAYLPSSDAQTVLELGTGSGAISLALASERPLLHIIATDHSPKALAVAQQNAHALGLAERIEFCQGNWFAPITGRRFDLIISNPPYIAGDDPHWPSLRHEPQMALHSEAEGYADLFTIIDAATKHLNEGGLLILEHGWNQAVAVQERMTRAGFQQVSSRQDLAGHLRCTLGYWI